MKVIKRITINKKLLLLFLLSIAVFSCVEEIPIEPETFEEAIVIEGSITNEEKQHQIKISKAFKIDTTGPNPLSGASVTVTGDREYIFEESEPGIYTSTKIFSAQPGVEYQLSIQTNGEEYKSEPMQLLNNREIASINANRITYKGDDGVAITLNQESTQSDANYYRYEYSETFKFNSRFFKTSDLVIRDGIPVEVPKTKEEYTCYRTEESQDIILANTNSLSEDNVNNLLLTFINADDPKLARRYSVLVKQYVISRGAYNYYATLEELSGSDNIFSQSQPGYFSGNIENINNPDEKIIGFFDVSSVSTKRTFFSYEDFFDSEHSNPYLASYCPIESPDLPHLIELVENRNVRWFSTVPVPFGTPVFEIVPASCVDCTVFGSNEVPDFWEE